jgi:hypothetical protein
MLYCQQIQMVMISFRIDIARKNDELMAYNKIDNLSCSPIMQQRTEEVGGGLMDNDFCHCG